MRFWERPFVGALRKRFYWWPRRVSIHGGRYLLDVSRRDEVIPYEPVWLHNLSALNAVPGPGYSQPRKTTKTKFMGNVTPVVQVWGNVVDKVVWLDWQLEMAQHRSKKNYDMPRLIWVPVRVPQQWNLWHEYD